MNEKQMQTWTKYVTLAEKLWEKYHEQGELLSTYEAKKIADSHDWNGITTMFEKYAISYPPVLPKNEKNYIAWSRELSQMAKPTREDVMRLMGVKQFDSVKNNIARMKERKLPLSDDMSFLEFTHNNDDKYLQRCDKELAKDNERLDAQRIPQKPNLVTIQGMPAKPTQGGWYQFI